MGECNPYKVEVIGSSPIGSTILIRKSNKAHAGSNPATCTKNSKWLRLTANKTNSLETESKKVSLLNPQFLNIWT